VEVKDLMVNHARSVGRKDLHPYAVGAIVGALKCGFTSEETVVLIGEIIETMHDVMDDKSLSWDVEYPDDVKKAPLPEGTVGEIIRPKFIIDLSRVEPLVDRVWAEEVLEKEENLRNKECVENA